MLTESFTLVRASQLTRVSDGGGTASEDITVHLEEFLAERRAAGDAIDLRILLLLGRKLI